MGQDIVFHLSRDEEQRARRVASPGPYGRMMWVAVVVAALWGINAITALVFAAPRLSLYMAIFFCLAQVGLAVAYGLRRFQPVTRDGAIRFSDAGITGTLNGEAATLPWKRIAGARETDEFIIIVPRRAARPIAMPKSSIDDAAQIWQLLEDRLVAKRGLVRSSPPRAFIDNTAS